MSKWHWQLFEAGVIGFVILMYLWGVVIPAIYTLAVGNDRVLIRYDRFHEQRVEAILFGAVAICAVVVLVRVYRRLFNRVG